MRQISPHRRLILAILLSFGVAVAAGFTIPAVSADAPADESGATLADLRTRADGLRLQLLRERRAHRRQLVRERRAHRREMRRQRRALEGDDVSKALEMASAAYGVPEDRLRRIAFCESRLDPGATNGPYLGLFQFGTPLWSRTPFGDWPRSDPYAAAFAAAWAFSRGMDSHWPICGRN